MSFNKYKARVELGDTVILYLTIKQVYCIKADSKKISKKGGEVGNVFQTPFGALHCVDLIGKEYGSKINLSKGWGYILQPTPELWTLTLPHRTQIIYTPDISMIIMQLEISAGSIVIECGTGSGSVSHALIRAVKPNGQVYTFDFHPSRVKLVEDEFKNHGLSEYVVVRERDVCVEGFGMELNEKADAIFLDLPHPWLVIPHTVTIFKSAGGRICSFSPCIEQVQRSCLTLSKLGFQDIQTVEVLQTNYSIQSKNISKLKLDFLKNERSGGQCIKKEKEILNCKSSVPPVQQNGHTGFLTFATMFPSWTRPTME